MPLDCTTDATPFDEAGATLKTLVDSDPDKYVKVDRGHCGCCEGPCCGYDTLPDILYWTIVGYTTGILTKTPAAGAFIWQDLDFPLNCNICEDPVCPEVIEALSCEIFPGSPELSGWYLVPPASYPGPVGRIAFPQSCDPFYFHGLVASVGLCPFEPDFYEVCISEIDPAITPCEDQVITTKPWWCVEIPDYPFRDCRQNVLEAVGGPYADEATCLADTECLPGDFYCVRTRDGTNPATFACEESATYTVGQVIVVGSVVKTVMDGPFTESRCECPPCTGGVLIVPPPECENEDGTISSGMPLMGIEEIATQLGLDFAHVWLR